MWNYLLLMAQCFLVFIHLISKVFDTEDEYNNLFTENFFLTKIPVTVVFLTITQKQRHLDIQHIKWNNFIATKRLLCIKQDQNIDTCLTVGRIKIDYYLNHRNRQLLIRNTTNCGLIASGERSPFVCTLK